MNRLFNSDSFHRKQSVFPSSVSTAVMLKQGHKTQHFILRMYRYHRLYIKDGRDRCHTTLKMIFDHSAAT